MIKKQWASKSYLISIFILNFLFLGCNSTNTTNAEANLTRDIQGKLIDSAVQGVEYRCGNIIDFTDANGTFSCVILPVSFHIGGINLGSISKLPNDKEVFPQDLVDVNRSDVNNSEVLKIALILQSLDKDKNASNGIEIDSTFKDTFDEEIIVLNLSLDELKSQITAKDNNITFKDIDEVVGHLTLTLGITPENNNSSNSSNGNTNDNQENNSSSNNADENTNNNQENNSSNNSNGTTNNSTIDTQAPTTPTLSTIPSITNQNSLSLTLNGEANADVYVNDIKIGTLNAQGTLDLNLDTAGDDGDKNFIISIKDAGGNTSSSLNLTIKKDSIPPAQNSSINEITTDDTTPALSGNLPSGDNDSNTTNYKVKIKIADDSYEAINNKNGTWSIEDDTISALDMGSHDVNITVTDEANNSSSTFLSGVITIDNTGFLIDSALEGIKYVSGAYSGYTDKDGLFKYDKGAGVTFYIGDESTGISLGTATQKVDPYNANRRIITLFDLAGTQDENNTRVINMGKFLQSLDADNDVSNGISIDERTKESIALLGLNNRIDFNLNVKDFHAHNDIYELFNDLAGHFGEHRGLIDTEDAKAHMVAVRDNTLATKSYEVAKVSGEKEVLKILDGVFQSIGGVVEGLEYRSGNLFGRTDVNGAFKYEEGKQVKFYIYQLELGTTRAKAVVTPADLVPSTSFNHPKPRNIIRLLNAFDAPASSNIKIDNAVREALEKYRSQIDINLPDGKADADLGIPQGIDEFGAQFEEFEMGKDILDEIDSIRGVI